MRERVETAELARPFAGLPCRGLEITRFGEWLVGHLEEARGVRQRLDGHAGFRRVRQPQPLRLWVAVRIRVEVLVRGVDARPPRSRAVIVRMVLNHPEHMRAARRDAGCIQLALEVAVIEEELLPGVPVARTLGHDRLERRDLLPRHAPRLDISSRAGFLLRPFRGEGRIGLERLRMRRRAARRRDRDGQHARAGDEDLLRARRGRPGRARQEPLDAIFQLPVAADRDPLPRQPSAIATHIVGDLHQDPRVPGGRTARAAGPLVAGELRHRRQLALQPPRQRVEPEHAAIEARGQCDQRIPAADVRPLVRDHRAQGLERPRPPVARKDDPRREHAGRERRGDDRRLVDNRSVWQRDRPRPSHDRAHRQPPGTDVDERRDQTRQIEVGANARPADAS